MLDMDAFSGVTEVKLVAELNVQKADADTDTPTQLLGTCQLSGLRLSDFQDAQRDAFKSAMAASSGAMKEHVSIRNVFAKSSRRRLLRGTTSQASNGGDIVVDFAIMIVRDSSAEPPAAEEESAKGLSAGHVAAIAGSSILAVLLTVVVVLYVLRKYCAKKSQVGFVGKSKRKPTESSKRCTKYTSSDIEMAYPN